MTTMTLNKFNGKWRAILSFYTCVSRPISTSQTAQIAVYTASSQQTLCSSSLPSFSHPSETPIAEISYILDGVNTSILETVLQSPSLFSILGSPIFSSFNIPDGISAPCSEWFLPSPSSVA